jgi:predicted neuraminidase
MLALSVFPVVLLSAGDLKIERVFGPETPTGRYKHPASITELTNGDLLLAYYGGEGEYAVNTGVFVATWKKETGTWGKPRMAAHDPFRSVGNGVVWQAPDGLVWLFYVVRWGSTWSTSRIQAKVSKDGGETWSDSFVVSEKEGMMVRGAPIVLDTGEYYLPVYHETGHDTENVGPDTTSRFLRFDTKAKEWKESGVIRSRKGNLQPAVVQLDSKHLVAYCRRGGGYGPVKDGYTVRAESNDGGRTWSEGNDTEFPNPNSAVDLLKLSSGKILFVYNDSMSERTPLRVALSADGTKTWPWRRNIAEGRNSYAYPFAIQSRDGKIHLVYTADSRTVVMHAVFDEEWVVQGTAH